MMQVLARPQAGQVIRAKEVAMMTINWYDVDQVHVNVTPGEVAVHFVGGGLVSFQHRGDPRRVLGMLLECFEEPREAHGGFVCPPINSQRVVYLRLRPVKLDLDGGGVGDQTWFQVWYEHANGEQRLPITAATTHIPSAWYAALRNAATYGETEVIV